MKRFTCAGKIKDWQSWINALPRKKGVYAIIGKGIPPQFLEIGTGGYFKGKNPNITIKELYGKWTKSHHKILYIGRAGKNENEKQNNSTIYSRVKLYMKFGNGKAVGHRGGRYIWQLKDYGELEIYYFDCDNPQTEKRGLIEKYKPFANLNGGD